MTASARRLVIARRIALLAAGGLCLLTFGGCYEHVVGARGAAADQYDIHDSYQESSAIDKWIWGDDEKEEYKSKPGIRTR